jgi:hypothetical protein
MTWVRVFGTAWGGLTLLILHGCMNVGCCIPHVLHADRLHVRRSEVSIFFMIQYSVLKLIMTNLN